MADNDSTLLTVVIIVIAALIVLWLLWSLDHHNDNHANCYGPRPDPVGGIKSESLGPGEVKISWDPTPNATHYRVYINATPLAPESSAQRRQCASKFKVAACGDGSCCPTECTACVSQSNYAKLLETSETSVIIETCEPSICYIVVPYNRCGEAGDCKTVNFVDVECIVDDIEAWLVNSDCNGLKIAWNCPRCCDTVHIYVDGQLVDSVDAALHMWSGALPPEGSEVALQCETACGLGELNVLIPGAPTAGRRTAARTAGARGSHSNRSVRRSTATRISGRTTGVNTRKKQPARRAAPRPAPQATPQINARATRNTGSVVGTRPARTFKGRMATRGRVARK